MILKQAAAPGCGILYLSPYHLFDTAMFLLSPVPENLPPFSSLLQWNVLKQGGLLLADHDMCMSILLVASCSNAFVMQQEFAGPGFKKKYNC